MKKEDFEYYGFIFKSDFMDKLRFEKGDSYKIGGIDLYYNINTLILKIFKNKGDHDNQGMPELQVIFEGLITNTEDLKILFKFLQIYNHNTI